MNFNTINKDKYSIIVSEVDKLNVTNASDLKEVITAVDKNNVNRLIIDLSATKYCDSSGLSALLLANRLCKNASGKFVLCGLQSNVLKMIKIAQLHRVLTIVGTQKEAEQLMMN